MQELFSSTGKPANPYINFFRIIQVYIFIISHMQVDMSIGMTQIQQLLKD